MEKGNESGKKMPVVIELNELDSVSGGALGVPVRLLPGLVANRCPPASGLPIRTPPILVRPIS